MLSNAIDINLNKALKVKVKDKELYQMILHAKMTIPIHNGILKSLVSMLGFLQRRIAKVHSRKTSRIMGLPLGTEHCHL